MLRVASVCRNFLSNSTIKRAFVAAPLAFGLLNQPVFNSGFRSMAMQAGREVPEDVSAGVSMSTQKDPKLPALSPADTRAFGRMGDMMEMFHNNFRMTWNQIYAACDTSSSASSTMSAMKLMNTCHSFIQHLTVHHDIEETHIFPLLGTRMPAFQADAQVGPLEQHRKIHAGLDKLEEYMTECRSGERSLRRAELKEILDSFGTVLWTHLAEEVEQLGAENMRKYWTKEEIARMPM